MKKIKDKMKKDKDKKDKKGKKNDEKEKERVKKAKQRAKAKAKKEQDGKKSHYKATAPSAPCPPTLCLLVTCFSCWPERGRWQAKQ